MTKDSIVEDVRQARAALLEKSGGTLEHLFDYLERQQAASGREAIVLPPKRLDTQDVSRPT